MRFMQDMISDKIRIDDDKWDDVGKIYKVLKYFRRKDSTAVELELEYEGTLSKRVVAYHTIEWLYDDETNHRK